MDITERLRALYVEHGTNYVREAADEIERLRGAISEGRSIKDKLAWCVEDLTKQLKARERELSKVLQQQAEADNERDAVEEGLRAYAELLRRELEDCCTRMDRCKGILRADRQAPEGWNVLDTKHARAALAKNPAAANAPVVNVTEGRPAPLPEASAGPECVHETNPLRIRIWHRGAPDSIVIRFQRDVTNEEMESLPRALMAALELRHQSGKKPTDQLVWPILREYVSAEVRLAIARFHSTHWVALGDQPTDSIPDLEIQVTRMDMALRGAL